MAVLVDWYECVLRYFAVKQKLPTFSGKWASDDGYAAGRTL